MGHGACPFESMKKYINYNLILLPLHLFLYSCLFVSILLTGDAEDFFLPVIAVTAQLYTLGLFPNIIYAIKKRKEPHAFSGLVMILPILVFPYILIALLMRVLYL